MALTKVTGHVVKTDTNVHTHNINSSGIVTAIGLDVNGNADISGNLGVGGTLTYQDVTSIDAVGVVTAQSGIQCLDDLNVGLGTFFVDKSAGTVGIGTDNPGRALTIRHSEPRIRLIDDDTGSFSEVYTDNTGHLYLNADAGQSNGGSRILFNVDGTEKVRINNSGQVGISTSANLGDAKLTVEGVTTLANIDQTIMVRDSNADDAVGRGGNIGFGAYVNGTMRTLGGIGALKTNAGNSFNGDLALYTRENGEGNLSERLRIKATGGVSFPSKTATVETTGITHSTNNYLYVRGGTAGLILSDDDSTNIISINDSNSITFGTNDGSERLRITSTGELLQSSTGGNNKFTTKRTGAAGSNNDVFFELRSRNTADQEVGSFLFQRESAADNAYFVLKTRNTGGSNTERLRILSTGLISIGDNTNLDSQLTITNGVGDCIRLRSNATNNTFKYGIIKQEPYNNNALGVQIIGGKSDSSYSEVAIGGGIDGGYAATHIDFYTGATTTTTTGTRRLRINSNGRLTLSDSEGIKLSAKTSTLYSTDGALSYYATDNGVYLNGAGADGWLRLQASGSANDRTSINISGHSRTNGDEIYFKTNSTERLRIENDGIITGRGELRLTEGTTTVSDGAEIGSLMYLYPSNDNKNAKIVALSNGGSSGADLAFYTRTQGDGTNADGGVEKLRIKSDGKVGIGTTVPANKLHIADYSADVDVTIEATASGKDARLNLYGNSTGVCQIRLGDETDANIGRITYYHAASGTNEANSLEFITGDHSRVRVASTGLVLPQTTNKIRTDSSDGSDNKRIILAAGGTNSQSRGAQIALYGNEYSSHEGRLQLLAGNSGNANGLISFHTGGSERFAIEADGDVRIGSSANYGWIRGWHSATGDMTISADHSATGTGTSKSNLIFKSRGSEKLRITSGGQLCLGTTSGPGQIGLYLGDGTNPAGHIYANGTHHMYILTNAYHDGAWKYLGNGEAESLAIQNGNFIFNTASTNSAGAGQALTWTERMTISSDQNIYINGAQTGNNRAILYNGSTFFGIYGSSSTSVDRQLRFHTGGGSASERMRISSDGFLLVNCQDTGFSSGYTDMTIGNTSQSNTGLTIASSSTNGYSRIHFADGNSSSARYAGWIVYDHATDALKFSTNNSGSYKVLIDSNGRLGLGALNPSDYYSTYSQFVLGKTNDSAGMTIVSGTSHAGYITFADGTSSADQYRGRIFYDHSANTFKFRANGLSNDIFKIDSSQVYITGTGDGVLNLDTSHASGTFIRFKQGGTTQHWIGCATGLGGHGGVNDLAFLSTEEMIWRTGSNVWMTLNLTGRLGLGVSADIRAYVDVRESVNNTPLLNLGYNDGSFYRNLGTVGPNDDDGTNASSGGQYLHVKLRTVWNDSSMTMFRITGYNSYNDYTESYAGMYRYGHNSYRSNPYGQIVHNQKRATLHSVYNTSADPGYLVLVLDSGSNYVGFNIEHIGAGGAYGSYMQYDLEILEVERSTATDIWK